MNRVAGQPTIYTVHLDGGASAQLYLDPWAAGAADLHVTFFDAAGKGLAVTVDRGDRRHRRWSAGAGDHDSPRAGPRGRPPANRRRRPDLGHRDRHGTRTADQLSFSLPITPDR